MNRNTLIVLAVLLVASIGIVAYGTQVGFVTIKNIEDTPDAGAPEFSLSVLDTNGQTVDWQSDDSIISGTIKFEAVVTDAGSNELEIFYVVLDVSTAGEFVGHWYFEVVEDQEKYQLDWDTTILEDGTYNLEIKYSLADPESNEDPPDGSDNGLEPVDTGGGGYDPKSGTVAFSMGLDTSPEGSVDIGLPQVVEPDYTIPLLAGIFLAVIIAYVVLRGRR